jgi:predicted acetyltransferase
VQAGPSSLDRMAADPTRLPIDPTASARLAAQGLRMALVDPGDERQLRPWFEAVNRGFRESTVTDAAFAEAGPDYADRRSTGVWDDTAAEPAMPVGTVSGWRNPLTVSPGRSVDAWAISVVTVAPTHRRRGIARAMLESELRTAAAAGIPVAMLTVSEATIYGRYGFAPAAQAAELEIRTRRAGWTGGTVPGRVQFVDRERLLRDAPAVYERARLRAPGGIALSGGLFTRLFGLPSDEADLRRRRFVRYDDADGVPQGYAVFSVSRSEEDFTEGTVEVHHLVAATDDADAALWRFLLEHDLVSRVTARLRSVDEPLRWLLADERAMLARVYDHLWLRILDPVAALSARTFSGPARLELRVTDPSGFASGRVLLDVDASGDPTVTALADDEPSSAGAVTLDAAALAALYLGGVSAVTLARARRLEAGPDETATLDRLFRASVAPTLGVWF